MHDNDNDKSIEERRSGKQPMPDSEKSMPQKELSEQLTELKETNEEIRQSRRAALNIMEDAILSREALRINEQRMRVQKQAFNAAIAKEPLPYILNILVELVDEEMNGKARTAFFLRGRGHNKLHPVMDAGNMPPNFLIEMQETLSSHGPLPCGMALPNGEPVITTDIFKNHESNESHSIAEKYDIQSCWSFPIKSKDNKGYGCFCMYFAGTTTKPTQKELILIDIITQSAAVIILNYTEAEERARAEETLRKSEEKYRTLFESINEGFTIIELVFDEEGNVVDLVYRETNRAFEEHTGLKNLVGKKAREVMPNYNLDRLKIFQEISRTGGQKKMELFVKEIQRWLRINYASIGGAGSPYLVGIFEDISTRKREESNLAFLAEITRYLGGMNNADEMITMIGQKIGAYFNVHRVVFSEITEDVLQAIIIHEWAGDGSEQIKKAYNINEYISSEFEQLHRQGKLVVVEDTHKDDRVNEERFKNLEIASFIGVPLLRSGKWRFYFSLADKVPRVWRPGEIELIKELGSRIWERLERYTAEEALKISEQRLQKSLSIETVGVVFLSTDGYIRDANCAYEKMSGLSREALTSSTIHWKDVTADSFMETSTRAMDELLTNAQSHPYDKKCIRPDGTFWWGRFTGKRLSENEIVEFVIDITEIKKIEQSLRKSEERLRITVESAVDFAIINLDKEGIIDGWNSGAEKIFGHTAKEALGNPGRIIFSEEDIANKVPSREMQTAKEKGSAADERWHKRKDGSAIFVSGAMWPIYNPELQGFVKVVHDLTEKKIEEQQKDDFISIASHELKTPVTSIKAYTEVLLEMLKESNNTSGAELIKKLDNQVDRLIGLIRALLNTSRIKEGKIAGNLSSFNVTGLLSEIIQNQQQVSHLHQMSLECDDEIMVTANYEAIGQVMTNLISNAIKYSPEGGEIKIRCEKDSDEVMFNISDQGIGISDEGLKKLFSRFSRAENVKGTTFPGLGLGLYISKNIVQGHGGRIWAESKPGEGSVFSFTLPLTPKSHNDLKGE